MCGIAGIIQKKNQFSQPRLEKMLDAISHRGPDGRGVSVKHSSEYSIGFGHVRLSIIDLSTGHQPMVASQNSSMITFNGEVYNYLDLKAPLNQRGAPFVTQSDTEVILQNYIYNGVPGLCDLNGFFDFAIYDESQDHVVLARDRVGIKPLYYTSLPNGGLAFCSEISGLLTLPDVSREWDPERISEYLFFDYSPKAHTIYPHIHRLEPGNYLIWKNGQISQPQKYWEDKSLLSLNAPNWKSEEEATQDVWHRVLSAVKTAMIADVPVGVFLSGGIDSSIVSQAAKEVSPYRLKTFSISFEDKEFDESAFAERMARHIDSEHIVETITEARMLSEIDKILSFVDDPIADPSIIPTYFVSKLARQHVKVVLGGDGGDELWAGYPTYKAHNYAQLFSLTPPWLLEQFFKPAVQSLPMGTGYQPLDWKLKRFIGRWDYDSAYRHFRWMSNTDPSVLSDLFSKQLDWKSWVDQMVIAKGSGNTTLLYDFKNYMVSSVLTKVDRASMAVALEVRPPLLENNFVDFSYSVPFDWKLKGNTTKYLLKQTALQHIPSEIVTRPKKGFAIPLARWLLGPLKTRAEYVINEFAPAHLPFLNQNALKTIWKEFSEQKVDHSKTIWALIVLSAQKK